MVAEAGMSGPRLPGGIVGRRDDAAPSFDRYEYHRASSASTAHGSAVSYSTDDSRYAPFRGEPQCVSRGGYYRRRHDFDRDGRCLWCDERELA